MGDIIQISGDENIVNSLLDKLKLKDFKLKTLNKAKLVKYIIDNDILNMYSKFHDKPGEELVSAIKSIYKNIPEQLPVTEKTIRSLNSKQLRLFLDDFISDMQIERASGMKSGKRLDSHIRRFRYREMLSLAPKTISFQLVNQIIQPSSKKKEIDGPLSEVVLPEPEKKKPPAAPDLTGLLERLRLLEADPGDAGRFDAFLRRFEELMRRRGGPKPPPPGPDTPKPGRRGPPGPGGFPPASDDRGSPGDEDDPPGPPSDPRSGARIKREGSPRPTETQRENTALRETMNMIRDLRSTMLQGQLDAARSREHMRERLHAFSLTGTGPPPDDWRGGERIKRKKEAERQRLREGLLLPREEELFALPQEPTVTFAPGFDDEKYHPPRKSAQEKKLAELKRMMAMLREIDPQGNYALRTPFDNPDRWHIVSNGEPVGINPRNFNNRNELIIPVSKKGQPQHLDDGDRGWYRGAMYHEPDRSALQERAIADAGRFHRNLMNVPRAVARGVRDFGRMAIAGAADAIAAGINSIGGNNTIAADQREAAQQELANVNLFNDINNAAEKLGKTKPKKFDPVNWGTRVQEFQQAEETKRKPLTNVDPLGEVLGPPPDTTYAEDRQLWANRDGVLRMTRLWQQFRTHMMKRQAKMTAWVKGKNSEQIEMFFNLCKQFGIDIDTASNELSRSWTTRPVSQGGIPEGDDRKEVKLFADQHRVTESAQLSDFFENGDWAGVINEIEGSRSIEGHLPAATSFSDEMELYKRNPGLLKFHWNDNPGKMLQRFAKFIDKPDSVAFELGLFLARKYTDEEAFVESMNERAEDLRMAEHIPAALVLGTFEETPTQPVQGRRAITEVPRQRQRQPVTSWSAGRPPRTPELRTAERDPRDYPIQTPTPPSGIAELYTPHRHPHDFPVHTPQFPHGSAEAYTPHRHPHDFPVHTPAPPSTELRRIPPPAPAYWPARKPPTPAGSPDAYPIQTPARGFPAHQPTPPSTELRRIPPPAPFGTQRHAPPTQKPLAPETELRELHGRVPVEASPASPQWFEGIETTEEAELQRQALPPQQVPTTPAGVPQSAAKGLKDYTVDIPDGQSVSVRATIGPPRTFYIADEPPPLSFLNLIARFPHSVHDKLIQMFPGETAELGRRPGLAFEEAGTGRRLDFNPLSPIQEDPSTPHGMVRQGARRRTTAQRTPIAGFQRGAGATPSSTEKLARALNIVESIDTADVAPDTVGHMDRAIESLQSAQPGITPVWRPPVENNVERIARTMSRENFWEENRVEDPSIVRELKEFFDKILSDGSVRDVAPLLDFWGRIQSLERPTGYATDVIETLKRLHTSFRKPLPKLIKKKLAFADEPTAEEKSDIPLPESPTTTAEPAKPEEPEAFRWIEPEEVLDPKVQADIEILEEFTEKDFFKGATIVEALDKATLKKLKATISDMKIRNYEGDWKLNLETLQGWMETIEFQADSRPAIFTKIKNIIDRILLVKKRKSPSSPEKPVQKEEGGEKRHKKGRGLIIPSLRKKNNLQHFSLKTVLENLTKSTNKSVERARKVYARVFKKNQHEDIDAVLKHIKKLGKTKTKTFQSRIKTII